FRIWRAAVRVGSLAPCTPGGGSRMTSADDEQARLRVELRAICDSLGYGGQTKLARMIGRDPRTIRNKLSGQTPITESDELAIRQALSIQRAVELAEVQ